VDGAEAEFRRVTAVTSRGSLIAETQQLILLHKVLKPTDQPLKKKI
jgi:hypothetical protein